MNYRFVGKPDVKLEPSAVFGVFVVPGGKESFGPQAMESMLALGVIEEIPEPKRAEFDLHGGSRGEFSGCYVKLADAIRDHLYGSKTACDKAIGKRVRVTFEEIE